MNGYLLDTNHAGRLLNRGDPLWRRVLEEGTAPIGVCKPAVGELWFMVLNSAKVEANASLLDCLLAGLSAWDFDDRAALEFGRIKTELRRIGRPIPPIDIQIAAVARCEDLTVVTADRHFSVVPNLHVENWLKNQ